MKNKQLSLVKHLKQMKRNLKVPSYSPHGVHRQGIEAKFDDSLCPFIQIEWTIYPPLQGFCMPQPISMLSVGISIVGDMMNPRYVSNEDITDSLLGVILERRVSF